VTPGKPRPQGNDEAPRAWIPREFIADSAE
jgi:hypothetical protein